MNFYVVILGILGILPILHLVMIGLIHIKSGGKTSENQISYNALLTFEIAIFLLSVFFPLADGGVFVYYVIIDFIGLISLIMQVNFYKNLKNDGRDIYITIIWRIVIVICLTMWIIYYIMKIVPIISDIL